MKHYQKYIVVMCVVVGYLLFCWYRYEAREDGSGKKDAATYTVVTTSYPLYLHTTYLAKETPIEVVYLFNQQVGCLHDYTLTIEDMKKLQQADALVINGLDEVGFLDKIKAQYQGLTIVDASEDWEVAATCDEEAHHEHTNPHITLSKEGAILQSRRIAEALIEQQPTYTAQLATRAKGYEEALTQLFEEPVEETPLSVVTIHGIFDEMVEEMGVEVVASLDEAFYENPSPKEVYELVKMMEKEGVQAVLVEEQKASLKLLERLQEETGCEVVVLDSINHASSVDEEVAMPYKERMSKNRQQINEVKRHVK